MAKCQFCFKEVTETNNKAIVAYLAISEDGRYDPARFCSHPCYRYYTNMAYERAYPHAYMQALQQINQ